MKKDNQNYEKLFHLNKILPLETQIITIDATNNFKHKQPVHFHKQLATKIKHNHLRKSAKSVVKKTKAP